MKLDSSEIQRFCRVKRHGRVDAAILQAEESGNGHIVYFCMALKPKSANRLQICRAKRPGSVEILQMCMARRTGGVELLHFCGKEAPVRRPAPPSCQITMRKAFTPLISLGISSG